MNFYGYYILNLKPAIFSFIGKPHKTPEWLRADALIEHIPWWHGTTRAMLSKRIRQVQHEAFGTHHRLMVHAPDEEAKLKSLGVKGCYVSQNIYVDKDSFVPLDCEKTYEAIYIAQLKRFKRHHLAKELGQIHIIAGDLKKRKRFERMLPQATFNDQPLSKLEIARVINSARCTLALSEVEGAMLASFESLLCGVPVVSTASRGGRDVFFNELNSLIVEPTTKAVAEGVAHFQTHRPDPHAIRARALKDIEVHKLRFCNYISDLAVSIGGAWVDPQERYQRYFGSPGGLNNHFIWADKFDRPADIARIRDRAFTG